MYPIAIQAVLNGFKVKVGCQTLVFNDPDTLCRELRRYLLVPEQVEKDWRENAINKFLIGPAAVLNLPDPTENWSGIEAAPTFPNEPVRTSPNTYYPPPTAPGGLNAAMLAGLPRKR